MKTFCLTSLLIVFAVVLYILGNVPVSTADETQSPTAGEFALNFPVNGSGSGKSFTRPTSDGGYIVSRGNGAWVAKLNSAGGIMWQKSFWGSGDLPAVWISAIQQAGDAGFIMAGAFPPYQSPYKAWAAKLDSSGNIVWQKSYTSDLPGDDFAYDIQPTDDGGYVMAGFTGSPTTAWILKLNANGDITWQKTYAGVNGSRATSIRQTSDHGYIVGGLYNSSSATGFWIFKLTSDGGVTWQKQFQRNSMYSAAPIVRQTQDSGYVLAGTTYNSVYYLNIIKLDAAGGVTWQKEYGDTTTSYSTLNDIQQTADNGYILGVSYGAQAIKLNSAGEVAWIKSYMRSGWSSVDSILPLSSGGYILASSSSYYNFSVAKVAADGGIPDCSPTVNASVAVANTSIVGTDTATTVASPGATVAALSLSPATTTISPSAVCYPKINIKQSYTTIPVGGSYQFGEVPIGSPKTVTFTIENQWMGWLHLTANPYVSIPGPTDYRVNPQPVSGTITFDAPGMFGALYDPQTEGPLTAAVSISNNDLSKNPYTFTLKGTGVRLSSIAYGSANNEKAYSILGASDGGYLVAGGTSSYGAGQEDWMIIKFNAYGQLVWQKTYGRAGIDQARSIQQTKDGGYIVAGWSYTDSGYDFDAWILKLDSSGNIVWQKTYGGASYDYAYAIRQTEDDGYIVAGRTFSFGEGDYDFWILKLDGNGGVTWQKTYGGTSYDYAYDIRQTTDEGYIVAGYTHSFSAPGDAWVVKLDNTGEVSWEKSYGGSGQDNVYAILQTSDSGYILAGSTASSGAGDKDIWVLKLNSTGNVSWQRTYGGSGADEARSIRITPDNGYIVSGYTNSYGAGNEDGWMLKLDGSGNVTWEKSYGGSGSDSLESVRNTADSGFIAAGWTNSYGGGYDFFVVKTDQDGNVIGCPLGNLTASQKSVSSVAAANTALGEHNTAATITATSVGSPSISTQTKRLCAGMVKATPPTHVDMSGPTTGLVGISYAFSATVNPLTTTTPITYVWQATGQSSVMNIGGLNDSIAFTWATPGAKTITVTATNISGTVSGSHTILVQQTGDVSLAPDRSGAIPPGQSIVYQHTLTNTGTGMESFTLTAGIDQPGWSVAVAPSLIEPLGPNMASKVAVTITAPTGIMTTVTATARITATLQSNPSVMSTVTDLTTSQPLLHRVHLPMIIKQ